MAAGDLVVADNQVELRVTLMGDTTNYGMGPLGKAHVTGLGVPQAKVADVELWHEDGAYGSPDYVGVRIITVPFLLVGTAAQAGGWAKDLNTAWAPSTSDIPLYMQLPGYGKLYVNGRPRGFDADLTNLQFGIVEGTGYFTALDPSIHYV